MPFKIINLTEDFAAYEIENYKKIISTILLTSIDEKIVSYVLEEITNKNFDIDSYNKLDKETMKTIKNLISKFHLEYKTPDDIVREEVVRYNMTMFEINCPPYLKIVSCLYLKNELKTKHYYEIDDETMKRIAERKDEQFRNLIIFKSIIERLCEKFGEDIVFCDEYTKQYSIDSFDEMIINFEDFIKEKKSKMTIDEEFKKKNFYVELSDFYYNKLLRLIISKKLPNCDYEILTMLNYQKKVCENNVLFNVLFNFVLNDILDKCVTDAMYPIDTRYSTIINN